MQQWADIHAYMTNRIGKYSPSLNDALIHFEGNYNHHTLRMAKICDTYQEYEQSYQFQRGTELKSKGGER